MRKTTSTYLNYQFTSNIDRGKIRTIVECGSRDCLDAIELNKFYHPRMIYSFECNPESIPVCEKNTKGIMNIIWFPFAVCNVNTKVDFYATDMEKSEDKNIGASSLLRHHTNNKEGLIQKKIKVEGIRLDTFMNNLGLSKIDLLCMDLQGSEHLAIEGLGERIKDVHYIISEIAIRHSYNGEMAFGDFTRLLKEKGFKFCIRVGDDALYIRA